jgi:HD-like signal output (HDOD) protein
MRLMVESHEGDDAPSMASQRRGAPQAGPLQKDPAQQDAAGCDPRERIREALTQLARTGRLPALPGVATTALAISREPDADVQRLARVLQTDVGLTARVLRVANSPGYGRRLRARSVSEAVTTLGVRKTCDILVAIAVRQLYLGPGAHGAALWNHSLAVAVAAEELAQRTRHVPPGGAFLPGLLHDIGRIAFMLAGPATFAELQARIDAGEGPGTVLERQCYEFDHAQVGGILAEDWGLVSEQCDAIRYHHEPDCAEHARSLATLVNGADRLAYLIGLGTYATPPKEVTLGTFGWEAEEEEALAARVREAYDAQRLLIG